MADQPNSDTQSQSATTGEQSDEQIVEALIGTETRSDVLDLVNRMIGGDEYSNKERGKTF
jgi:hypothetical protein